MERRTLAIGIGVGMLGVAGVGLGAVIRAKRRSRQERRSQTGARATADDRGRGASSSRERGGVPGSAVRGETLPPPSQDAPRTATRMAPGIPVGSGRGIDRALAQPDTDIGGGVTGDTSVTGTEGDKGRDERTIRNEDHDRTTL